MPCRPRFPALVLTIGILASCQASDQTPRHTTSPGAAPAVSDRGSATSARDVPRVPSRGSDRASASRWSPQDGGNPPFHVLQEGIAQADTLQQRFLQHFLPRTEGERQALSKRVGNYLATTDGQGRFRDIAYKPHLGNGDSTGWGAHLIRVADMAMAWRMDDGEFSRDPRLPALIRAGMDAYVATPFDFKDQWGYGHPYGDLMETKRLGIVCLCTHGHPEIFPQADIERWADRIPPFIDTYGKDFLEGGANLLWTAWGEIAGALVRSDQARRLDRVDAYFRHLWSSMLVRGGRTSIGGCPRLTWDHMLGEHDVPCMGTYGEWYLNDVLVYDVITRGLPRWTMPEPVVQVWVDVLVDGVAFCYQGAVDPHLINPAFWLNARKDGNPVLRGWLGHFQDRGYRTQEIADLLTWTPGKTPWPRGDRSVGAFPTIDFMTKHFRHWMWSGRAVSERTLGLETFDQKDLHRATRSSLLPFGASFLRRDATTLQDTRVGAIWDAYDFGRPSGMTTRHADNATLSDLWNRDAKGKAVRRNRGSTTFSGMAALSHTGVMAWWQGREVVVDEGHGRPGKSTDILTPGRHAVFVLENAVVHLGAALDARHPTLDTLTSVEQRLSTSSRIVVGFHDGRRQELVGNEPVMDASIAWVWYDEVLYVPPAGTTTVQDLVQRGPEGSTSWMADAQGVKRPMTIPPQERQIFSIFTNHGRTSHHLDLNWAIIPGIAADDAPAIHRSIPWTIVANTSALQALAVPGKSWIGVAFHEPGTLPSSMGIPALTVDRPLILAAQRQGDALRVAVADPLGNATKANIGLDDRRIVVNLPQGGQVGFTHTFTMTRKVSGWEGQSVSDP